MSYPRYYGLTKNTVIYTINSWRLKIPKGTPIKVTKNTLGEIIVSMKIKEVIIVLRREKIAKQFRPIAIYINGELFGYANYKNPPFPLSLIP